MGRLQQLEPVGGPYQPVTVEDFLLREFVLPQGEVEYANAYPRGCSKRMPGGVKVDRFLINLTPPYVLIHK